MTDWAEQVARKRGLLESVLWILAAAVVALVLSATVALTALLDVRMGRDEAEPDALMVDLTAMPVTEMVAEEPAEEAPEHQPEPVDEPEAFRTPEPEAEPDPVRPPEPEVEPVREPLPEPIPQPELLTETLPVPDPPPPPPEPEVVVQTDPEVRPKPRPEPPKEPPKEQVRKPDPPKKEPVRTAEPRKTAPATTSEAKPSAASSGGAVASARGGASPDAVARWKRKVLGQLDSHMRRKRFDASRREVVLAIRIDGAGQVLGVSIHASSGLPDIDSQLVRHAGRRGSVAAPPDGKGTTLLVPITMR